MSAPQNRGDRAGGGSGGAKLRVTKYGSLKGVFIIRILIMKERWQRKNSTTIKSETGEVLNIMIHQGIKDKKER